MVSRSLFYASVTHSKVLVKNSCYGGRYKEELQELQNRFSHTATKTGECHHPLGVDRHGHESQTCKRSRRLENLIQAPASRLRGWFQPVNLCTIHVAFTYASTYERRLN
jgi:hypothetical protein